ncbi:MAG: hypothetical protein MAG795_00362 [Candidatus Woesearchaeota archaeon]|nr:hypothetical protein [Candidatus Woesearchaeota archaeon]
MHKARYYYKQKNKLICTLCPHSCHIGQGEFGICGVRKNIDQTLYSLNYNRPLGLQVDPIEKKPLFHFLPGKKALSFGTAGCNLGCLHCQNWHMSQKKVTQTTNKIPPEDVIRLAIENDCKVIAYTYNEPTIFFEYMLECAKLANKQRLKNIIVSNGYINQEPLHELCEFIDGANIDLKAFNNDFYKKICMAKLEPVKESLKTLIKKKIWLEITNLIIPTKNDSLNEIERMCKWIVEKLGKNVPIHFSRFRPDYKLQNISPTPRKTLENAKKIAEKYLNYVYVGNIWIKNAENTYCPDCTELLVQRKGFKVVKNKIKQSKCACGHKIRGVWN